MLKVLIALSAALLAACTIILLTGKNALRKDAVRNRLYKLGREIDNSYVIADEDFNKPFSERVIKPAMRGLTTAFAALLPLGRGRGDGEEKRRMLRQAGWTISPDEYTAVQIILMIVCGAAGFMAAVLTHAAPVRVPLFGLGGAFGAYTIQRFYTKSCITKRQTSMEKQLPDMLDLLSISVAAGLGFERAMLHIIETMDGPLIDELAVTYREMSMGRSRKDAFTLLGERCGVEDLSSVTGAIVQAGQLGIPLKNVLQSQSAAIRRSRKAKVQEKAAKVSTKILIPMVGFIFPVLIIVLMGPSILTIMEQFGQ